MAANACFKCDSLVKDNGIRCSGQCNLIVHYKCAGLKKSACDLISSSNNVHWFCDNCNNIFKVHCDKLSELTMLCKNIDLTVKNIDKCSKCNLIQQDADLSVYLCANDLLGSQNKLSDDLNRDVDNDVCVSAPEDSSGILIESQSLPNVAVSVPAVSNDEILPKKPTNATVSVSRKSAGTTPWNVSPPICQTGSAEPAVKIKYPQHLDRKSICGTRQFAESFGVKVIKPTVWLHLSKFDPQTSEGDVSIMAKTCLEIEDCKVFKLIPKQRNTESLEFVCYKLGINADLLVKALDPNTWPTGVHIREFRNGNFRTTLPPRVKFRPTDAANSTTR